jgi:hypothetical protein
MSFIRPGARARGATLLTGIPVKAFKLGLQAPRHHDSMLMLKSGKKCHPAALGVASRVCAAFKGSVLPLHFWHVSNAGKLPSVLSIYSTLQKG